MKAAVPLDSALGMRVLAGAGSDVAESLLREIQDRSSRSEYSAAARLAAGALEDGATDVRVLAPFLLGVFLETGPAALPGVLDVLRAALSDRWAALRPEPRKARVADSSLSSLFRSMSVQIDFHSKVQDATFRAWAGADSATAGPASLAAASALRTAIDAVIDKARSTVQLSEVEAQVRAHFTRAAPKPVAPPPLAGEARETGGTAEEAAPEHEEAAPPISLEPGGAQTEAALAAEPLAPARTLEISPAMETFLRKLEAFERLVAHGDMERAAVVSEDVRATLENFDPRLYLPRLLSSYSRALAANLRDIAPFWESIGSPQWRALDQLYRVDLDAFVG